MIKNIFSEWTKKIGLKETEYFNIFLVNLVYCNYSCANSSSKRTIEIFSDDYLADILFCPLFNFKQKKIPFRKKRILGEFIFRMDSDCLDNLIDNYSELF
jgi:hypothetical protein